MKHFLIISLIMFSTRFAAGAIYDLSEIPVKDEFVDIGRRVSYSGWVSIHVIDEVPYLKATFRSKIPFAVAVKIFDDYLAKSGLEDKLFHCPFCPPGQLKYVWFGFAANKERKVTIDYMGRSGEILINISSEIDEKIFYDHKNSFTDIYPEFQNISGMPDHKYETIAGGAVSVTLVYTVMDSSQKEVDAVARKLRNAGWKDLIGQAFNIRKNECMALLAKDGYKVSVVCTENSLVVNVVPYR